MMPITEEELELLDKFGKLFSGVSGVKDVRAASDGVHSSGSVRFDYSGWVFTANYRLGSLEVKGVSEDVPEGLRNHITDTFPSANYDRTGNKDHCWTGNNIDAYFK
jgi:hypothetical protein